VPRTIFAMGGGGFTAEPRNPLLDDYILSLSPSTRPRILFLPTASGDPAAHLTAFIEAFGHKQCETEHLSLFRLGQDPRPVRERVLAADIVYVGGGSLLNLIAIWKAHGFDAILHEAWENGTALAGLSAGSMCWFEWGVTTSTGAPAPAPGLGWLPGSNTVHYDGEPSRRPVYLDAVASGEIPGGFAVDDGVGLRFAGSELVEAVSSRPQARAFRVERDVDKAVETPLAVRFLGSASPRERQAPADIAEWRALRARRASG
jgi:dipeptidase E